MRDPYSANPLVARIAAEFQAEPDPFPSRKVIPLRAVGGNVLLRKVAMDVHRGNLIVFVSGQSQVLQVGEIVGLGSRWTQDRPWQPPMPNVTRGVLNDGSPDMSWTPPDLSMRPAVLPPRFSAGHQERLALLKPGDLVVYTQARAYDVFNFMGEDILVYPGCWIHGVVEDASINDVSKRRYLEDSFDTAAPDRKLRG
jgi:hypothetical protein